MFMSVMVYKWLYGNSMINICHVSEFIDCTYFGFKTRQIEDESALRPASVPKNYLLTL